MFVITAKVSKTKLAAVAVGLIALVVLIVMLAVGSHGASEKPADGAAGDTNEARLAFLTKFGWQLGAEPVKTQQVTIPQDADNEVFARYNELQKSQGFDLTKYAGKSATRYVYEVLNYDGATEPVYATLFVCDGVIVGGDVTNSAPDGKMHGFERPAS